LTVLEPSVSMGVTPVTSVRAVGAGRSSERWPLDGGRRLLQLKELPRVRRGPAWESSQNGGEESSLRHNKAPGQTPGASSRASLGGRARGAEVPIQVPRVVRSRPWSLGAGLRLIPVRGTSQLSNPDQQFWADDTASAGVRENGNYRALDPSALISDFCTPRGRRVNRLG
jgi:hypothetical protein